MIYENKSNLSNYKKNPEEKKFLNLLKSKDNKDFFEILYRLSILILSFQLSLFAILISKTNPRNINNYSVGYGLIFFFLYYNSITYALSWADENKFIESSLFFLYPHIFFLLILSIIFFSRNKLLNPKKIL